MKYDAAFACPLVLALIVRSSSCSFQCRTSPNPGVPTFPLFLLLTTFTLYLRPTMLSLIRVSHARQRRAARLPGFVCYGSSFLGQLDYSPCLWSYMIYCQDGNA